MQRVGDEDWVAYTAREKSERARHRPKACTHLDGPWTDNGQPLITGGKVLYPGSTSQRRVIPMPDIFVDDDGRPIYFWKNGPERASGRGRSPGCSREHPGANRRTVEERQEQRSAAFAAGDQALGDQRRSMERVFRDAAIDREAVLDATGCEYFLRSSGCSARRRTSRRSVADADPRPRQLSSRAGGRWSATRKIGSFRTTWTGRPPSSKAPSSPTAGETAFLLDVLRAGNDFLDASLMASASPSPIIRSARNRKAPRAAC